MSLFHRRPTPPPLPSGPLRNTSARNDGSGPRPTPAPSREREVITQAPEGVDADFCYSGGQRK